VVCSIGSKPQYLLVQILVPDAVVMRAICTLQKTFETTDSVTTPTTTRGGVVYEVILARSY
jgi:hypothetical protein